MKGYVIKLLIIQSQSGIMYIMKNGVGIYMATIKVICPYCKSDKVVCNGKTKKGMFGGLAIVTDYPIEAPYDDAVTYSITLQGKGALVDFSIDPPQSDTMPE